MMDDDVSALVGSLNSYNDRNLSEFRSLTMDLECAKQDVSDPCCNSLITCGANSYNLVAGKNLLKPNSSCKSVTYLQSDTQAKMPLEQSFRKLDYNYRIWMTNFNFTS